MEMKKSSAHKRMNLDHKDKEEIDSKEVFHYLLNPPFKVKRICRGPVPPIQCSFYQKSKISCFNCKFYQEEEIPVKLGEPIGWI